VHAIDEKSIILENGKALDIGKALHVLMGVVKGFKLF
jgi:hypothetical protein